MKKSKKILVISSYSISLVNFRFDLLKDLVGEGYEVIALGPDYDENTIKDLKEIGVRFRFFHLQRTGFNPIKDFQTIKNLRKIFKEEKPDFILPYTVKPVLYSNLAKNSKIKSINWITGLGFYGLESKTLKDKISKFIMTCLYKISLKKNDVIVFQNEDDVKFFKRKGILKGNKYKLTPGSGININQYAYSLPITDTVKFLFVGRLIEAKGIHIFIKAAEVLKSKYQNIEFIVVGGLDEGNPNAVQKEELDNLAQQGIVNFVGQVNNVIDYINDSSVFVLPSMYREGVPRSILEALSVGRPIITTDNVGCRETIIKEYNGVLIAKNNVQELIDAMEFFCNNKDKIIEYGENSRQLAKDKFDVTIVNKIMIDSLMEL